MKRPLVQKSIARKSGERGVTIALVALAMVAIMAIAALSIDVVTLYLANAEMQRVADTAALSAARILSLTGMTGDPGNSTANWQNTCTLATQVANAIAQQNTVSGAQLTSSQVTVTFPNNSDPAGCTGTSPAFGVNPLVSVLVRRTDVPTFFARIFSIFNSNWRAATVSASATAEAFNPSNSNNVNNGGGTGTVIPVQPRCVKPWLIPNLDPGQNGTGAFLNLDGSIAAGAQGIRLAGGTSGVIGDTFELNANCQGNGSPCQPRTGAITDNVVARYWPAKTVNASTAVPSCGAGTLYEEAVAGCDDTTIYACGVPNANVADLSENPKGPSGDSTAGAQCLTHESGGAGQDTLDTTTYPFKILAGSNNPLVASGSLPSGTLITASPSLVSLPIYDSSASPTFTTGGMTNVTVIGFLQLFINSVNSGNSRINVTVLNVAGCGNGTAATVGTPVAGSSPVPVRLVEKYP